VVGRMNGEGVAKEIVDGGGEKGGNFGDFPSMS